VVLIAFFAAPIFGVPIGVVALIVAVIVTIVVRLRGWMTLPEIASSISWGIFVLVIGLFLVVQGVENVGLTQDVRQAFAAAAPGDGFLQILGVAMGSGVGSNLINNLPAAVMSISALRTLVSGGTLGLATVYAVLLGTNIGPNLTVAGSLATLIWLGITRSKGIKITAKDYLKIGAISTPVVLLAAVIGLWVSLRLFGS
jgi:arsenical pump membrane protein